MDIYPYVADLLKQQNEVNLPGFGVFYKQRIEGFFDREGGVFVPPSYQIAFKLSNDSSSDLANYISAKKNLSKPSSEYFIEQFTTSLKKNVEDNPVNLGDLGLLYKENDEYILKPTTEEFIDFSSFGLPPIEDLDSKIADRTEFENLVSENPVSENEPEEVQEIIIPQAEEEKEEIYTNEIIEPEIIEDSFQEQIPELEAIAEDIPQLEEPASNTSQESTEPIIEIKDLVYPLRNPNSTGQKETEQEIEYSSSKTPSSSWLKKILLILLILCVAMVGGYLFYPQVLNQLKNLNNAPIAPTKVTPSIIDSLTTKEDSLNKADQIIQEKLDENGFKYEKSKDTVTINTSEQKLKTGPITTYEIIVVSFDKKSVAEEYVQKMKKKGIDAFIIDQVPGNRIKVSLGSFTNKDSADVELRRIQQGINKEAWIFRHKTTN